MNDVSINYFAIFQNELNSMNDTEVIDKEIYLLGITKSIDDSHNKGKLNIDQFNKLKNDISIYYFKDFKKKINSPNFSEEFEDNLKRIANLVEDAFSNGTLTEIHYNLLKKGIEEQNKNIIK